MNDDDLRHLERDLAVTGTPAARLAYARALERAGRSWRRERVEGVLASTTRHVLALEDRTAPGTDQERWTLVILDRQRGDLLARLEPVPRVYPVILARDAIYLVSRCETIDPGADAESSEYLQEIAAVTLDGRVAWRFSLESLTRECILALAPLNRKLLVLVNGGSVFCLEEGP